jgi:hypothetical protein
MQNFIVMLNVWLLLHERNLEFRDLKDGYSVTLAPWALGYISLVLYRAKMKSLPFPASLTNGLLALACGNIGLLFILIQTLRHSSFQLNLSQQIIGVRVME